MTGYFITLVVGIVIAVATRLIFWGDLRRAQRRRSDPRIGLLAPSLFLMLLSWALVVVGLLGVVHEAQSGQHPPVPLAAIWLVLLVGLGGLIVSQHRRRTRRRRAWQEEARRRVRTTRDD